MIRHITRARAGWRTAATLAAALLFVGCSRDTLLEVETPDQIPVDVATSPVGAQAIRASAIGNFAQFYAGDVGGSGVGLAVAAGLLSDEMESARGGTEHLDSRAQIEANFPVTSPWSFAGQAVTQIIRAIAAVKQFYPEGTAAEKATKVTQTAQLYALLGYSFVLLGENYCNGIPISNANDLDPQTDVLSNADLFNRAIEQFDLATSTIGTSTTAADVDIRNLAAVGRGRALVDLAKFAEAATAVAAVPSTFVYNITYSTQVSGIVNAIYDWMFATLNFAPTDKEGGNGVDYVTAQDPRVKVVSLTKTQRGQDGITHWVEANYTRPESPVPLATGVEARLIEAEAALKAGDATGFITKINAARRTRTDLPDLTDPGTQTLRENMLFRERALWFWGTAHRVGDLRRLMRQYGRTQSQVWPTGTYFKGGTFGTDVSLVPSQAERNNPNYKGCTDRNA